MHKDPKTSDAAAIEKIVPEGKQEGLAQGGVGSELGVSMVH